MQAAWIQRKPIDCFRADGICVTDCIRWVSLHNGGGTGWGEAINGGFGLVLDGSEDAAKRAAEMLFWYVRYSNKGTLQHVRRVLNCMLLACLLACIVAATVQGMSTTALRVELGPKTTMPTLPSSVPWNSSHV
jgi:hypothetical protein